MNDVLVRPVSPSLCRSLPPLVAAVKGSDSLVRFLGTCFGISAHYCLERSRRNAEVCAFRTFFSAPECG
jgi:hypothetical protein